MAETFKDEMDWNNENQQPNSNNMIDLSAAIDEDVFLEKPKEKPNEFDDFCSSYKDTNVPISPIRLTYDNESELIRLMDTKQNMLEVPYRVHYPFISAQIAKHPVKVQIFAATSGRQLTQHQFYEVFLIPSEHSHACNEEIFGGIKVLQVRLTPETGMSLCCDFIGIRMVSDEILKIRFPGMSLKAIHQKKSKCFRIVFRTIVYDSLGFYFKLQTRSNMIYYKRKEVVVPVVEMVSHNYFSAHGGIRLMIFGKNFTSEALVIFSYPTFDVAVKPCQQFLYTTHLACIVPACERQDLEESVVIDVFVECGKVRSLPFKFIYLPNNVLCCTSCVDLFQKQ
ncbi:hypothetical protein ZHAS_00011255 [Anopheles sinensis]|uniref:IPT/TIG domain-containing protein n=1 Tax=Anopheles sinensis TaxID=74873 RepID=A0A084VZQ4_ANOSI|nr:hypothetical protein ZHAS_00011255 [Anopheles sinensis]